MSIMQKLRALALEAQAKIWSNRFKDTKWDSKSFDSTGRRAWKEAPIDFLVDKLREEVNELVEEATVHSFGNLPAARREAGDVAALAMMLVDRIGGFNLDRVPRVVCLCGSTKFKKQFEDAEFEEGLKGNIVLTVVGFLHHDALDLTEEEIARCHKLHLQKIDLADEIFVVNPGGYIGDTTRAEVMYAAQTGKKIRFLEPSNPVAVPLEQSRWPFPE